MEEVFSTVGTIFILLQTRTSHLLTFLYRVHKSKKPLTLMLKPNKSLTTADTADRMTTLVML